MIIHIMMVIMTRFEVGRKVEEVQEPERRPQTPSTRSKCFIINMMVIIMMIVIIILIIMIINMMIMIVIITGGLSDDPFDSHNGMISQLMP